MRRASWPYSLVIEPLKVESEKSALTPAGRLSCTQPLTVSTSSVAPASRSPSNCTPPLTLSSCARSKRPPSTCRRPFTVEASTTPLAPWIVTGPFTELASTRWQGQVTSTPPFTDSARTSLEPAAIVMPLLTVSASISPSTPSTAMSAANESIESRERFGTLTSRSERTPWGLPRTSTVTSTRCCPPESSRPSARSPSVPTTSTSLRSQPTTRIEPAALLIWISPSGAALRRCSTRSPAAASEGATTASRTSLVSVFVTASRPLPSDAGELLHPLQHPHLLLMRREQQMVERPASGILGQCLADLRQRPVDLLQVALHRAQRLGRQLRAPFLQGRQQGR